MRWICCCALMLVLPLRAPAAQEPPTLAPGARVRVTMFDYRVVGTLQSIDSASIVLRRHWGETVSLPRRTNPQVDVSAGGLCGRGRRVICVAVGLLGGAAVGRVATAGFSVSHVCDPSCFHAVVLGALAGMIVGAVVGGEQWNPADLPARLRVSMAPGNSGTLQSQRAVHVGLQFAF